MRKLFILTILITLSSGCSGLKTYPNDLPKNIIIEPKTKVGYFAGVKSSLHIYDLDKICASTYVGTVDLRLYLDEKIKEVGVPTGKPTFFILNFTASSFTGTTSTDIHFLVDIKKNTKYKIVPSYIDNTYNIGLFEKKGKKFREISPKSHDDCKPEA